MGELERLARGEVVQAAVRSHAARCAACAEALAEIRENDRFLGGARSVLADAIDHERERPPPPRDAVRGFEIVEEIGRGGQGVVYRAVQSTTKRPAAIKILLAGAFASERQRHRFEREVEIAARLRHPNIVSVFASGQTTGDAPYVAMEHVDGVSIDVHVEERFAGLAREDRSRVNGIAALLAEVASGVGYAHTSGVIHRDLKPSNILIDGAGRPRVLDFGLARPVEASVEASATREFVGTPAYASPEQLAGDPASINVRSDVYALGLILYRLLTGVHPYPIDGSLAELARHAIGTEPMPPSRYVRRLPSDIETIVLKCLAKAPERRYASAVALASDIEDYLHGRPISARRDSAAYVLRKLAMRHRVPAAAGMLVVLTVIAATIGLALLASDLDRARRRAEAALAESDVQRARLMATAGSPEQAERLIWANALRGGADSVADRLFQGDSDSMRDAWALAELYAISPCALRLEPGRRFESITFAEDERSFWAIDSEGARWTWSIDGSLLERTPALFRPLSFSESAHSRDGKAIVVTRVDGLEVYEVGNPRERPALETSALSSVWFISPDGDLLASVGRRVPEEVVIRRVSDLAEVGRIPFPALNASWTRSNGEQVLMVGAVSGADSRILWCEGPDWRVVRTLSPAQNVSPVHATYYRNIFLSPDARTIVSSMHENVFLSDVSSEGDAKTRALVFRGMNHTVAFSGSGQILFTVSSDGEVAVVDVASGSVLRTVVTGCTPRSAVFSETHMTAIIAATSGGVLMYRLDDRRWLDRLPTADVTKGCVDASATGDIAWGNERGEVHVLIGGSEAEAITFRAHHAVDVGEAAVNSLRFSADGSKILTAGMDGAVREWSRDGRLLRVLGEGLPKAWSAVYSPDGRAVAAGFYGGTLRIWRDGRADAIIVSAPEMNRVPSVAFAPDGSRLIMTGTQAQPVIVDALTGAILATLDGHAEATRVATWSPDGQWIVTGCDDRKIRIWNARTLTLERTIAGLPWGPFQASYHRSGAVLFAIGRGGEILVIDPRSGNELARLPIFSRLAFDIAFSADGNRLFVAGQGDFVGVLDFERLAAPIRANTDWWRRVLASDATEGLEGTRGSLGP